MKQTRTWMSGMILGLLAVTVLTVSPARADRDDADDRSEKVIAAKEEAIAGINASNRRLEAAIKAGNGAAVAALYTPEGQLLPSGSDFITGAKAIANFWQGGMDAGMKGLKLKTLEIESRRGMAQEVGTYETFDANGKVTDHGKYIVLWKKDGDAWKLHRDIWNTSVAPAKP